MADSLSNVECALLVEDAVARLRHDVFNSLSAVRSAAYYIQRRVAGSEPWQADPRIEQFFLLIAQQLDAAVARVGVDPKADLPHQRHARLLDAADCVRSGLRSLESRLGAGQLKLSVSSGPARVDPDELALAVSASASCLLDAAASAELSLTAASCGDGYEVALEASPVPALLEELDPPPRALAIARRVAIAAGGRFTLEREANRLRIRFAVPDGGVLVSNTKRVLIIDDEVAGRTTLAALLELEGHEVEECGTLKQAAARLNMGAAFDAVLVDRRLPDGQGDSLAPAIRSALPNAAIVLMTGDAVDGPPPGFHAASQKGMDPSALIALVSDLLSKQTDAAARADPGRT